ncbi:hypothetical protein B6N25_12280 [Sphingobacteriales bacterium TSM_CSS]|nr:hypothetical protein B6N25_12280 [Sphingobacteriales bacterium TSM_CSS]
MKHTIVLIIALLIFAPLLKAQYDVNYHSCTGCTGSTPAYNLTPAAFELTGDGVIDVVSDFGRRTGTGISNWHRGVDITLKDPLTEDEGYHVLSITNGRVGRILGTEAYKLISITGTGESGNPTGENFGYGHIFQDEALPGKLGDMSYENYTIFGIDQKVIIYHPSSQTPIALAHTSGGVISYTDEQGTVWNLTTTNIVAQGAPIAPLGTSGGVLSHIHLYRFVDSEIDNLTNIQHINNCKDPLQILNHYDTQYTLSVTTQTDAANIDHVKCRARVAMNIANAYGPAADQYYSGGIMDIDQVEVLIKKLSEPTANFEVVQGSDYNLQITENSRVENVPVGYGFYPNANTATGGVGSWAATGIAPFAYGSTSTNTPYDDFYFLNFRTRIHKNDNYGGISAQYAYITEDARYPDGNYYLLASATTVNGAIFDSDPNPIVIDNFRPYIKEVLITQGGVPRYHAQWTWNAAYDNGAGNPPGRLEYALVTPLTPATTVETMEIQITASEPMDEITFTIGNNATFHNALSYTENNTTAWFQVEPAFLAGIGTGDQLLGIIGQDLTLNELTGFPFSPNPYTALQLPHRTGTSTWSVPFLQTTDVAHFFHIPPCVPGGSGGGMQASGQPCFLSAEIMPLTHCGTAFNPENQTLCTNTQLALYNVSCDACSDEVVWDFNGATAILVEDDPENPYYLVSWNTPGAYTVSLTLSGAEAYNASSVYTMSITVSNSPDCNTEDCDNHLPYIQSVQIIDIATGNTIAHQAWQWNTDQTQLCLQTNITPVSTGLTNGLTLIVTTSEDMSSITFSGVKSPDNLLLTPAINDVFGSGSTWNFNITFDNPSFESGDYRLQFAGTDLTGNLLEGMQNYPQTDDCISAEDLPYRNEFGQWVNSYPFGDEVHGFTFSCLQSVEIIDVVCETTGNFFTIFYSFTHSCFSGLSGLQQADFNGDGEFDAQTSNIVFTGYLISQPPDPDNVNAYVQFTFTDSNTGETLILQQACNDFPVSDECQNDTPEFDAATFGQNPHYCLGEQVCINYYVTDATNHIANVTCSVAGAIHTYQSGYYTPPGGPSDSGYGWQSGTFCFTPTAIDALQGDAVVFLSATDDQSFYCRETGHSACIITNLCCPTGFDYPQELTAVYDCNGNLYQPATATITALTNGCSINFTVNGSSNHTLTNLGEGVYDLTLEFNNEIIQIPDAITVTGIYLDDTDLQVTHTAQPSLAACNSDQCTGQITLSVTGGTGSYTYHWSDCLPCNSPQRNHLCSGAYTVTIADDETGCQTVYTANVGQTYPATAGALSDNEFSVAPTVFSGSTTLTYRVAYDAQVSISMFNSQGNIIAQPITNEFRSAGQYSLTHTPPAGLPAGIYYYVLYVCEEPLTRVAVKVW